MLENPLVSRRENVYDYTRDMHFMSNIFFPRSETEKSAYILKWSRTILNKLFR